MHIPSPMPLARKPAPFDDPDWIFEIKHDGFRTLEVIERGQCGFFSRKRLLHLNGEDLRDVPLVKRKERLKRILPSRSPHVLYVDHTRGSGTELYRLCCQLDPEGIVAKRADSPL